MVTTNGTHRAARRHAQEPATGPDVEATKVVRLSLDEPLGPLAVEPHYREVLFVVESRGSVLGEVWMPAMSVVEAADIAATVTDLLGDRIWRHQLAGAVYRAAARSGTEPASEPTPPTVSVVVCTRNRADQLARCLQSLVGLSTPATEIIVVDNCPADESTRRACESFPVRYLREDIPGASRARNRGIAEASSELIAVTDDDCTADPRWLDDLGAAFDDPLVMAVTGYIGPAAIETRGQYLFEAHGGFEKHFERRVFDGARVNGVSAAGPTGASANVVYRRRAFELLGGFAEDLGPGTPAGPCEDAYAHYRILAAGYRIVFDPGRIVWHHHRAEVQALRRLLFHYAAGVSAFATRCLVRHREPAAVRVWRWWLGHLWRDLRRALGRHERRVPVSVIAAELAGVLAGPARLLRSSLRYRRLEPIEIRARPLPSPQIEVREGDLALTVALASRNRRESLQRGLLALAGQTYPSARFEAVVVLDGSTDDSAQMTRSLELPYPLRVIEQDHRGLAAARNRGLREAAHPIVVFLDDDIVADSQFLAAHAAAHRDSADEHVALGYYPPQISESSYWATELRRWWEDHFRRKGERGHQWTFADFVDGNCSAPRGLIVDCGGWDESFSSGRRQDWEFALRLLEKGVRFGYYPAALGRHYVDTSFETAIRNARREGADDVRLASKHPHMRGQLGLAHHAAHTAVRNESSLARALKRARRLEALKLKTRWRELTYGLLSAAYVLGMRESVSGAGLDDFVATLHGESSVSIPLDLDGNAAFRLPPGVVSAELVPRIGGRSVAAIMALDANDQWDWQEISRRLVEQAGEPLRERSILAAMEQETPPAAIRSEGAAFAD